MNLVQTRAVCAAFIGESQYRTMLVASRGEEGEFFKSKFDRVARIIQTMPRTYGQDGLGRKAIAYLHYFASGADWYITELDADSVDGEGQRQCFGVANIGHGDTDMGYISLPEILEAGAELDLHFEPQTIESIEKANV